LKRVHEEDISVENSVDKEGVQTPQEGHDWQEVSEETSHRAAHGLWNSVSSKEHILHTSNVAYLPYRSSR